MILLPFVFGACAPPVSSPSDTAAVDTAPEAATRGLLAVDNGRSQLLFLDDDLEVAWTAPLAPGPRDLALQADRVLVSDAGGATWHALSDGSEIARIASPEPGVQSAQPRSDGGIRFAADTGSGAWWIDVDATGAEIARVALEGVTDLRLVRTLPDGHVLLTASDPYRVEERSEDGAVVATFALPGKGYLATRGADGRTFATTGAGLSLITFGPDGTVEATWQGRAEDGLDWFSGFDHDPVSNDTWIANWLGHNAWGTGPHLIHVDATGSLVETWEDHEAAMQVTHVLRVGGR